MNFHDAYEAMKKGKKMKLPIWKTAYWTCRDSSLIEVSSGDETTLVRNLYPFSSLITYFAADTWEIATPENCSLLEPETFGFETALKKIKEGQTVRRFGWPNKAFALNLLSPYEYRIDVGDLLAEDWYLVGEDE